MRQAAVSYSSGEDSVSLGRGTRTVPITKVPPMWWPIVSISSNAAKTALRSSARTVQPRFILTPLRSLHLDFVAQNLGLVAFDPVGQLRVAGLRSEYAGVVVA